MKLDIRLYQNCLGLEPLIRYRGGNLWKFIKPLDCYYPNISDWFKKAIQEIYNFDRYILIAVKDDQIVGVAIFKKTKEEEKISLLKIREGYRNQGIGSELIHWIVDIYRVQNPIITISEEVVYDVKPFLEKHNFYLEDVINDLYRKNTKEYIFRRISQ